MKFPKTILNSIRHKLEREKKITAERLSSIKEQDPFADPERLNDNASIDTDAKEDAGHDRIEAIKRAILLKLGRIEKALGRLKKGGYGICEHCGKPIEDDRLAIMPTATLCFSCERERER